MFSRKIGISSGILFQKIGIRNGHVFEASVAGPRPKSGQVHPRALKFSYSGSLIKFLIISERNG